MAHVEPAVTTLKRGNEQSSVAPLRILEAADVPPDPNAGAAERFTR